MQLSFSVILLEIVMVSPGTHLVKNHESYRPEPMSSKLKTLGTVTRQSLNLKTDLKTLYHSLLKLKCSLSIQTTKMRGLN